MVKALRDHLQANLFWLSLIFFLAAVLGIFAFTRPLTRPVPDDIIYRHIGLFNYTAHAGQNIYDGPTVQAGEPVFSKITCEMTVTFGYTLASPVPPQMEGTAGMVAEISGGNGWKRTLPVVSPAHFNGNAGSLTGTLNICEIQDLLETVKTQTGMRGATFWIAVVPQVEVKGSMKAREFSSTFRPSLVFALDSTGIAMSADDVDTALRPVKEEIFKNTRLVPNTLPVFGLLVPVQTARVLALGLGSLSLLALGIGLFPLFFPGKNSDPLQLARLKWGATIVDVSGHEFTAGLRTIEVRRMEDLVKTSEIYSLPILHASRGEDHHFYMKVDGTVYHYCQPAEKEAAGEQP